MVSVFNQIQKCTFCRWLPLWPRPIVSFSRTSKILIIGQAPGSKVHETWVPWDDLSGKRLREWMWVTDEIFYDNSEIALMPMGFCYPGKGKSWDLPPTPECAPKWHKKVLKELPNIELVILIGWYAQKYYLWNKLEKTLTKSVKNYKTYLPKYFVLPHPSPRNNIWMAKNSWFEKDVLPKFKQTIQRLISSKE